MNELRHTKEKNFELQFNIKKMDKVSTDLVNANANLKSQLRKLKNKRHTFIGNFAGKDDVLQNEQAGRQRSVIHELEGNLESSKKGRLQLVNKHMNFKMKCERTIERLSLMLRQYSLRTNQYATEAKFYRDKIKEFMRRHGQALDSGMFIDLEVVLKTDLGSVAPSQHIEKYDHMKQQSSEYSKPASDLDANMQLQQILEEQDRYNQLIVSTGRNMDHQRFKSVSSRPAANTTKHKKHSSIVGAHSYTESQRGANESQRGDS